MTEGKFPSNYQLRALVDRAVEVLQRHAPPNGLSDHDALTELYGIFDGPEYRAAIAAPEPPASEIEAEIIEQLGQRTDDRLCVEALALIQRLRMRAPSAPDPYECRACDQPGEHCSRPHGICKRAVPPPRDVPLGLRECCQDFDNCEQHCVLLIRTLRSRIARAAQSPGDDDEEVRETLRIVIAGAEAALSGYRGGTWKPDHALQVLAANLRVLIDAARPVLTKCPHRLDSLGDCTNPGCTFPSVGNMDAPASETSAATCCVRGCGRTAEKFGGYCKQCRADYDFSQL